MEYEKIRQLMEDMGNSKLTEINMDFPDGTKISMKKEQKQVSETKNTTEQIVEKDDNNVNTEETKKKEKGNVVKSPMVGTFYLKPSPTDEPYVQIGKKVEKGDTLCIIEAMKLMNEIESEFSGNVTEILIDDGEAVQYGTPLFRIE